MSTEVKQEGDFKIKKSKPKNLGKNIDAKDEVKKSKYLNLKMK